MASYSCETHARWSREKLGRTGSEDKPELEVAAPPELGGHFGVWTPKDLLVAACESDVMLTFLALAERSGLDVVSYESRAVAEIEGEPESARILKVDIYPDVEVASKGNKALKLLREVENTCLVSRSLNAKVQVHPKLRASSARRSVKIIQQKG